MTNASNGHESFKLNMDEIGDKIGKLVHEGNVRKIIVKRGDDVIAEFPLTAGVVAAAIAPPLAAIGAIAALVTNCTIVVEKTDSPTKEG